jgi:hypothetical protein
MRFYGVPSNNILIFVTSLTAVSVAYSLFCITESQIDPIGFPTLRIVGYSTDDALNRRVILLARLVVDLMNQLFLNLKFVSPCIIIQFK